MSQLTFLFHRNWCMDATTFTAPLLSTQFSSDPPLWLILLAFRP